MKKNLFEKDVSEDQRKLNLHKKLGRVAGILTLGWISNSRNIAKASLKHEQSRASLSKYNELILKAAELDNLLAETEIIEGVRISNHTFSDIGFTGGNDYGIDWDILRGDILERDCYECQETDGYCKGPLQIHHIIPLSKRGTNDTKNLITLCHYHHSLKHKHMERRL